ncbi:MAG TPA: CcoQ/FixQ family Cbb3-type cytochrome c oxidase assembly chaperone [Ignavibacteria bacterium]|nr:CcoQ/FixQ family Cbb3-type cytochrome c oxidase assembly chaperone [Ignavibacteria bacterium]
MFKHYFELIDGIDIFPVFSLLVFFIFFIGVFYWTYKVDNNYIKKMEEIPFEKNGE